MSLANLALLGPCLSRSETSALIMLIWGGAARAAGFMRTRGYQETAGHDIPRADVVFELQCVWFVSSSGELRLYSGRRF